jgi:hypothetical protein
LLNFNGGLGPAWFFIQTEFVMLASGWKVWVPKKSSSMNFMILKMEFASNELVKWLFSDRGWHGTGDCWEAAGFDRLYVM